MWRGDVDRFLCALRQDHPVPPRGRIHRLDHVREIAQYYAGMSQSERLLLLAWAKKEESGIGIIPLTLSAVPFLGLLMGSRIQEPITRLPLWAIFGLWGLAGMVMVAGIYIHQRHKAFTMLHITLLEQAIKRGEAEAQAPSPQPEPAPEPDRAPPRSTLPPTPGMH